MNDSVLLLSHLPQLFLLIFFPHAQTPVKHKHARRSILKEIEEKSAKELTPRKKKLYNKLRGVYRRLYNVKPRLKSSQKMVSLQTFRNFQDIALNLSNEAQVILEGIIKKNVKENRKL